jgi:hypothetical protein
MRMIFVMEIRLMRIIIMGGDNDDDDIGISNN